MVTVLRSVRVEAELDNQIGNHQQTQGLPSYSAAIKKLARIGLSKTAVSTVTVGSPDQERRQRFAEYLKLRNDGINPMEAAIKIKLTPEEEKEFNAYYETLLGRSLEWEIPEIKKELERGKSLPAAITSVIRRKDKRLRRAERNYGQCAEAYERQRGYTRETYQLKQKLELENKMLKQRIRSLLHPKMFSKPYHPT